MNKAFLLLLTSVVLATVSCKKEKGETDHIALEQKADWTTTSFKGDYTIQFPAGYTGYGVVSLEGRIFAKKSPDEAVVFGYSYCSAVSCVDFGKELASPTPNTVNKVTSDQTITLDQKLIYTDNGSDIGVFYYNTSAKADGKLYWKDEGVFKEAAEVRFDYSKFSEVKEIIRTIKHI